MAHALNYNNGRYSMFAADKPAWHGLGQIVKGAQSWEQAMELANLTWTVEKQPLFNKSGETVNAWGIFRSDNGSFLGAVGARYTPIQNEYAFGFVDALLEADEGAHYESAGCLGAGEKVWCLARVPHDFELADGDKHETFLLFATSHDGSLTTQVRLSTVRVVCQNTLNAALRANGNGELRIKHTSQAEAKLEQAKKMLTGARITAAALQTKLDTLATRQLDKDTFMSCLDRVFPLSKNEDAGTGKRNNILMEVTRLFESNDNNAFPSYRGTGFNLLNAITEYTDHKRTTRLSEQSKALGYDSDTGRRESALFGSGDTFKQGALEILLETTSNCQVQPYKGIVGRSISAGEAMRAADPKPVSILDSILDTHHS